MKGITQLIAVASLACLGSMASAANLIQNGDFENNSSQPSLQDWTVTPVVVAATSTFGNVTDAAYLYGIVPKISQNVMLTAGDTYDLSGEAQIFGFALNHLSIVDGSHTALSVSDLTGGAFSFDFTPTKTGTYKFSFSNSSIVGYSEISDLSLGQPAATPEPCSMVALGVGVAGILRARKRR